MSPKDTRTPETLIAAPNGEILKRVLADQKTGFLVWRAIPDDDGGFAKMPVDPETGSPTAPNSAEGRAKLTLDEALRACEALRAHDLPVGVGTLPRISNIVALDLDNCVGADGTIEQWARDR